MIVAAGAACGLLYVALPASAGIPAKLTGSASVSAGAGTVRFTYAFTNDVEVDSVRFVTHQDVSLPASGGPVFLDGGAVSSPRVTASGGDLSIALGTLAAGVHTVRFMARVQETATAVTESSADVSYVQGGVQEVWRSGAVRADINEPDIAVTSEVGDGPVPEQPLGTGTPGGWDVLVSNIGSGAPPTTLRIALPTGLALTDDVAPCCTSSGQPLPCTRSAPSEIACTLGALPPGRVISVSLGFTALKTARPGTTASVTVTATLDQGDDHDPSNNTLNIPIRFTGSARLTARATTPAASIRVGQSTNVTVTVHNAGPQPSGQTFAFITFDGFDSSDHFRFTRFDGDHSGDPIDQGVEWSIGTLRAGQTATAHLTVRALSRGTAELNMFLESDTGEMPCKDKRTCAAVLALTALPRRPPPAPTPTQAPSTQPSAGVAGGNRLSQSGVAAWSLTYLGLALLALGVIATRAGRRPGLSK